MIKKYYLQDPMARESAGTPDMEDIDLCQECSKTYEGDLYEDPGLLQAGSNCQNCLINVEVDYNKLKKLYQIVTDHSDCNPMVHDQDTEDLGEYLGDLLVKEIQKRKKQS